jgi:hypothetical protein
VENIIASDHATTALVELARSGFPRDVTAVRYKRASYAAIGQRRSRAVRLMLLRMARPQSRSGPDHSNAPISAVVPSIVASTAASWHVTHKTQKPPIARVLQMLSHAAPVARLRCGRWPMPLEQPARTRYRTAISLAVRYLLVATSVSSYAIKANVCPA